MLYKVVDGEPIISYYNYAFGFPEDQNPRQFPPDCPPFRLKPEKTDPRSILECMRHKMDLCDAILKAIKLAKHVRSKLESKPLDPTTANKFRDIFGHFPGEPWELPGQPRQNMPAGLIVANRFRRVASELETRVTIYYCTDHCTPPPKESSHPTDAIVVDLVAWAAPCQDEVWLCPGFWTQPKEEQVGTLLHEMFHLCYGLTCAWFQHDGQERKRNSAYCYEAFALSVAGHPYPPGHVVQIKCNSAKP